MNSDPARKLAATLRKAPERLYLELAALAHSARAHVLLFVDHSPPDIPRLGSERVRG